MHEYSIVAALVGQVEREAAAHGARRVHGLEVAIGELAGVDPQLLATAWEIFRERTVCAGATLAVRDVPARWACPRCEGKPEIPPGVALRCPSCGGPARLAEGDEIILERVELEVGDV